MLESKTGFYCHTKNYDIRQKEVKKFLSQWEGRNVSLVYQWHKEVISPEKPKEQP